MRQVDTAGTAGEMIIHVSRFGQTTLTLNVPVDCTVTRALELASYQSRGNEKVFVAGVEASGDDILEDGDVLSIVTPKQAGGR